MAYTSAIFVARQDWQRSLKLGLRALENFWEVLEDELISDEMWRPFTELLAMQRVELDLGPHELDALFHVMGVEHGLHEPSSPAIKLLTAIKYDFIKQVSVSARDAFVALHGRTNLLAIADQWQEALTDVQVLHSSLDVERRLDVEELIDELHTFFCEAEELDPESSIFLVGYVM